MIGRRNSFSSAHQRPCPTIPGGFHPHRHRSPSPPSPSSGSSSNPWTPPLLPLPSSSSSPPPPPLPLSPSRALSRRSSPCPAGQRWVAVRLTPATWSLNRICCRTSQLGEERSRTSNIRSTRPPPRDHNHRRRRRPLAYGTEALVC